MVTYQRDKGLPVLVRDIKDDPSIQLSLLRRTDNGWHDLDPTGELSQEPFPFWEVSRERRAAQSIQTLVLNKAKSYLGTGEDSHGRSRPGIWFGDRVHDAGFDAAPWCDMFAAMVMWEIGGEELLKVAGSYALTTAHAAYLHGKGVTNRPDIFSKGSLVFQNWDLNGVGNGNLGRIDHVEFVERDNRDGTIQTVGGNVDNGVRRRTRNKAYAVVQAEWWKLYSPAKPPESVATSGDWYMRRTR